MNREMPFVGSVAPPLRQHQGADIAACKTIGSAFERAMVSAHLDHEILSKRMGVSRGYLSLMISGKRIPNVCHVLKAVRVTGSLAPIQWQCVQVGGEFYADPAKIAAALKRAEAAEALAEADRLERGAA